MNNRRRSFRRCILLLTIVAGLLTTTGAASAAGTITTAEPLPLSTSTPAQLIGKPVAPQYWKLELGLAERIRLDVNQPLSQAVTINIFRPGVTDATIATAKPVYTGTAVSTTTPKRGAFFADTPGTWIVQATSTVPTAFSMTATRLNAPTPNPRTGAFTTVLNAPGLVVGTLYSATTYDAEQPDLVSPRIATIAADQGDRVKVALAVTNRRGLRVDVFEPGTTDASIATDEPIASVEVPTNDTVVTLAFTAEISGDYVIHATSTAPAGAKVKPSTFTVQVGDVAPSDLQPPCADDITNIGRTRVKGCLESGPGGSYLAKNPVTISGVILDPLDGSTMVINPKDLTVTSKGKFAAVIWGFRLPADNYFEFAGTQELNLLDPDKNSDGSIRDVNADGADQRGLAWSDLQDGRSDVNGPSVGGLPLTGKIVITWGLDNGGQATVTANANIPGWDTTGNLRFAVSNDNGLDYARVAFGSSGTTGIAFNAQLSYQIEQVGGLAIDVWSAGFSANVGSVAPPAMLAGGEGAIEIRDGVLSYVRVGVRTQIPIGSTGIFVSRIGMSLRWSPYLTITGFGSVTAGPVVAGASVIEVSGEGGYAAGGACPGSAVNGERWFFDGNATIATWFTVGSFGLCYQGVDSPFISAYTDAGFSAAGVVEGRASLKGYIEGTEAMMLEGNAKLKVFGVTADGTVVLSDYGFAACGSTIIRPFGVANKISVGWEKPWGAQGSGSFACPDFSPYRTAGQARNIRAADGWPIAVPANAGQVNIIAIGADGQVPAVELVDAAGTVIARSTSTTENTVGNALFIPQASTGEMIIAAPLDKAGTYRVRAQAGSTIASVKTSLPLPEVGIKANVKMSGRTGILTYSLDDLAGRSVEFWAIGDAAAHSIGSTSAVSGTIRFREYDSLGGRHRIRAVVTSNGSPSPARTVATFDLPRPKSPTVPGVVTSKRAGKALVLRWTRSRYATAYRVRIVDTDGRRINTVVNGPAYRLRVSSDCRLLVEVTAIGSGNLRSTPRRAVVIAKHRSVGHR